jgi:hypothetical protein
MCSCAKFVVKVWCLRSHKGGLQVRASQLGMLVGKRRASET